MEGGRKAARCSAYSYEIKRPCPLADRCGHAGGEGLFIVQASTDRWVKWVRMGLNCPYFKGNGNGNGSDKPEG